MDLSQPVDTLLGVGPSYIKKLANLDIFSLKDLLFHFPFRYDDYSNTTQISFANINQTVSLDTSLGSIKNIYTKNGKNIQIALVSDKSGSISVVWFNQPYLVRLFIPGQRVLISGKVSWWNKKPAIISPAFEILNQGDPIHTSRLVPVYHEAKGVSSKWLRTKIFHLLREIKEVPDPLPPEILKKEKLPDLKSALLNIHFPENINEADKARHRMAFDELLSLHLQSLKRKSEWQTKNVSSQLVIDRTKTQKFINSLPFQLTADQRQSSLQIIKDLAGKTPMNRLLSGDVGSGKTVVGAIAAFAAMQSGKNVLFMAPTQILATQHHNTLNRLFAPYKFEISLLTSSTAKNFRLQKGPGQLIIGTHALIHQKQLEDNSDLGLVIIDEQHRFGVRQRTHFVNSKFIPHLLTMTATPIPRTVALTLYGDLDISQIKSRPSGRQRVTTWLVPPGKRDNAYKWMEKTLLETNSQAFIICPFIEPSETQATIRSAKKEFDLLQNQIFPRLKLTLLHGKMKPEEKNHVMAKMQSGHFQILVATPIVEVGIDLPNATIILIEDAAKFGLAQLHQLRGRVGRGDKKSYCLLFTGAGTQTGQISIEVEAPERLKAMEQMHSGIELAQLDLKLRGPGDIFGTSQHGFPALKAASYTDIDLINNAGEWAKKLFLQINKYPALQAALESTKIAIAAN